MAALSSTKCAASDFCCCCCCCCKDKQWSPRRQLCQPQSSVHAHKGQETIGHWMPARLGHVPRLETPLHPGLPINYRAERRKGQFIKPRRNSAQFHRVLRRVCTCTRVYTQRHTLTLPTLCFTISAQEGFRDPVCHWVSTPGNRRWWGPCRFGS